jgi:hypothetical protein
MTASLTPSLLVPKRKPRPRLRVARWADNGDDRHIGGSRIVGSR